MEQKHYPTTDETIKALDFWSKVWPKPEI